MSQSNMQLEFMMPSPALRRHVSVYYRIQVDAPLVEDLERADVGYLRFFLKSSGHIQFANGVTDTAHPTALHGPATETGRYILQGPLDCFGAVLLPDFWGGVVDIEATECANRCMDSSHYFGTDMSDLYVRLQSMDSIEDMSKALDTFLVRRVKPIPADQSHVIDKIGDWLRCFPIPAPEALHAALRISERQTTRIANRYFGAPPKMLARKFRALRTASRLIGTRGPIPQSLITEYSDRAHLTREIKHFTGLTPKQLQVNTNPIVQATLHPDNFRADAPWT
jgi:AraC-like DNA-binding protein